MRPNYIYLQRLILIFYRSADTHPDRRVFALHPIALANHPILHQLTLALDKNVTFLLYVHVTLIRFLVKSDRSVFSFYGL